MSNFDRVLLILIGIMLVLGICWAANLRVTELTELAETPASTDYLMVVDVSDTTMAATGTTKKIKSQYLAASNVTLVPIDGDINTYITAATAGDTLELAPGTYTVTASIDVSKQLNIIGQGNAGLYSVVEGDLHGTRILCATANVPIFNITHSNVRIAHMSLYHSGAGDVTGAVGFKVANNLDGIVFTNVDIVMPSGAGLKTGYDILGSIALLRDCAFYITSTDGRAYGVYAHNDDSTTINAIVDCHTVSGTTIGGAIRSAPFYCYNANDANTITMNLFSCWGKSTNATANDCGAFADSLTTNNAKLNVYQTTLDGGDYDIEQSGTNTVTIYGGILVNNTTNGTITYGGTVAASVFTGTITNAANVAMLNETTDTTCFPLFSTTSTPGNIPMKTSTTFKYNSNTGEFEAVRITDGTALLTAGALTGLTTPLTVAQGGTGSGTASGALVNLGLNATAAEINTPLDGASVTLTEFRELETIGDTTISANQWALLGGLAETLEAGEVNILDGVSGVTAAELSYIGDVTGLIQAQIDGKQSTLTNEAGLYAALSDVSLFLEDLVDDTTPQLGGPLDFNNKVLFDDWTAFTNADATPNVSAGSFFKTANAGATTITDFDDTDDHGDFQDGRLLFVWVDDSNTTFDFTASELTWASQGANDYAASEDDHFIFKFDDSADQWYVVSGPMPSVVSISTLTIPWGDADVTLDSGGDFHLNESDGQLCWHSGDSGEVSGEVCISELQHFSITFDPKVVCDGTIDRLFLFTVKDDAPEGITIDEWKLSFEADPTTEFAASQLHLKRADAMIGVANAAEMDDLATTNGASSEDTDANINGDAVVANGQVIYLQFDSAYTETGHQVLFEMWYHAEED